MTALTAARDTPRLGGEAVPAMLAIPVKASTKIYAGSLVAINAGYAVPASAAQGLIVVGRARQTKDNTSGANGDLTVEVERGIFRFGNSSSGDAIAQADVGKLCYAVDDQTVAKTNGDAAARSAAGIIIGLDGSAGVWVQCGWALGGLGGGAAGLQQLVSIPVTLSKLANGAVMGRFTPGFTGSIERFSFSVTDPATTAAKAATVTPKIAGVATTGGALALTSANCTPIGAKVDASAITAANAFGPTDEITLEASSVTAFVEGAGVFYLALVPA